MEREQMNGQIQQQSAQASILGKQAEREQEHGYKMQEMTTQADINKEADERKHKYTMDEILLKGKQSLDQKEMGVQGDLTKELLKPKKPNAS